MILWSYKFALIDKIIVVVASHGSFIFLCVCVCVMQSNFISVPFFISKLMKILFSKSDLKEIKSNAS